MEITTLLELADNGVAVVSLYVIWHLIVKLMDMLEKSTAAISASREWFQAMTAKLETVDKKLNEVQDDVRRNECKAICPVIHSQQQRPSGQGAM